MLLPKMIKKSIISITNKQRDKCMSPWILIPSPNKERKTERKGSCLHVNHLPFMENESVIIQLTIKCIANINDKVPIFWKCFNQRPIQFSWLAWTISDDLTSIGGSTWHMFLGQLVVGNVPVTHNKTLHHLCHQQFYVNKHITLMSWKTNVLTCIELICIFFETI